MPIFIQEQVDLFESVFDGRLHPVGARKLITEKMFGTNGRHVAVQLGNGSDPGAFWEFASGAFDELGVGPTHIGCEMNDGVILDHDQHGLAVADFDFGAHGIAVVLVHG